MKSVVLQSRKFPMGRCAAWPKMPVLTLSLALLCGGALVHGPEVRADEVRLPIAENVRQGEQQAMPRKGESRATVESRFGEPQRRTDPVGKPPISQWHYADFVVYFENNHVIHSVAKR
jgi:hypothetical protein